ncbi:antibiotic biosynthesis monooxygenase family protein [Legionella genomosp. 1]|uniref:antibiotic biosynthesis monooxygenase family protein n=1 Tax=Legionella genomosp. 1 TaxID=1093625 RepID=UPI0010557EE8|nr:hypothetical protein [Legionella genomosp. 1]
MFAVIYRSYIKPELENEYQKLWNLVASYFIQNRGAIGSCLHKTEDGIWLAYSRWPDKATRDASWSSESNSVNDLPDEIKAAITKMKACGIEECRLPEICMDIVDDLLPG